MPGVHYLWLGSYVTEQAEDADQGEGDGLGISEPERYLEEAKQPTINGALMK